MNKDLAIIEKLEKELNLKQLQIKSLLTITQAINDNIATDGLFNMYKSFLSWEMGIEKMALFVVSDEVWKCSTHIKFQKERTEEIIPEILQYKRLHLIKDQENRILRGFDVIIPVFHKDLPIAYSLIGGIKDKDDLYNKIQFITTITNIIAVAIENKKLFKRQLQQQMYKRDMELAIEVQQMLIPDKLPKGKNYELSKIYMPHSTVGGDYLDYIRFDEHRFAICIADISGKGVGAAILMANFQAMVQSFIYQYRDMETFIVALNQAVFRITKSDKFITFFIAEINTKTQELKYVNAGHYPPILVQDDAVKRLDKGCPFIGAFEHLPFVTEEKVDLSSESLLLSFTDGLVELKNDAGHYFDDTKVESFVRDHMHLSTEAFNDALLQEIESFKGVDDYSDDIAILTCKFNSEN